jgi:hypothetical protein
MKYLQSFGQLFMESTAPQVDINDPNKNSLINKYCTPHIITKAEVDARAAIVDSIVNSYIKELIEDLSTNLESTLAKKMTGYVSQLAPLLKQKVKSAVYSSLTGAPAHDDRASQLEIYNFLLEKINSTLSNPIYSIAASGYINKGNIAQIIKEVEKVAFKTRASYLQMIRFSSRDIGQSIAKGLPECTSVQLVDKYDKKFSNWPKPPFKDLSTFKEDAGGLAYNDFIKKLRAKLQSYV